MVISVIYVALILIMKPYPKKKEAIINIFLEAMLFISYIMLILIYQDKEDSPNSEGKVGAGWGVIVCCILILVVF